MSARIFGLRFSIFYAFLTIGLGMQLPFLPLWLHAKGLTVAEIGLVIAGMTAARFVAIPVAAYFADRYRNRRGLIILFSLASSLGYLLLGLSTGFLPILVSAILASLCIARFLPWPRASALMAAPTTGWIMGACGFGVP